MLNNIHNTVAFGVAIGLTLGGIGVASAYEVSMYVDEEYQEQEAVGSVPYLAKVYLVCTGVGSSQALAGWSLGIQADSGIVLSGGDYNGGTEFIIDGYYDVVYGNPLGGGSSILMCTYDVLCLSPGALQLVPRHSNCIDIAIEYGGLMYDYCAEINNIVCGSAWFGEEPCVTDDVDFENVKLYPGSWQFTRADDRRIVNEQLGIVGCVNREISDLTLSSVINDFDDMAYLYTLDEGLGRIAGLQYDGANGIVGARTSDRVGISYEAPVGVAVSISSDQDKDTVGVNHVYVLDRGGSVLSKISHSAGDDDLMLWEERIQSVRYQGAIDVATTSKRYSVSLPEKIVVLTNSNIIIHDSSLNVVSEIDLAAYAPGVVVYRGIAASRADNGGYYLFVAGYTLEYRGIVMSFVLDASYAVVVASQSENYASTYNDICSLPGGQAIAVSCASMYYIDTSCEIISEEVMPHYRPGYCVDAVDNVVYVCGSYTGMTGVRSYVVHQGEYDINHDKHYYMRQCDAVDIQYDIPVAGDYRMWIQNQDGGYMNDWDSALFDGAVGSHQVSWLLPAGGAEKERVRVVIDKYSAAWTVERREYGEWITLTAGPYGFIEPGENVIVEQGRSLTVNYGYDSCNENATYELVLRNGSTEHVLLSGECGSGGYYEGVFKVPYSAEMIGRNVVALNMEDGSGSVSYVKNGIVYIHAEGELNAPIVPYDSDGGGRLLIKPYGRPIEIEVMGTVIRPLLYSVSLYDLRGRCVKEIATAEPYDTKEMASGVYFMRNKRVGVAAKMVVIK